MFDGVQLALVGAAVPSSHNSSLTMVNAQLPTPNRLLAALSPEESRRISADLTVRPLKVHQTLQRRGEPLREVYFPSRALCSLTVRMADGKNSAEIAVVGSEGVIGIAGILGSEVACWDATVCVAGNGVGYAMKIEAFRRGLEERGAFCRHVTSYAHAFVGFLAQSVACNGRHTAEARCCRWLLHAQDRLAVNELHLTHDVFSTLLAIRRPTVTLAIEHLVRLGIISTSRGVIRIIDRTALEAHSCECYTTVKALFEKIVPVESSSTVAGTGLWG
jgi:CRP-like cAMP-binding protein